MFHEFQGLGLDLSCWQILKKVNVQSQSGGKEKGISPLDGWLWLKLIKKGNPSFRWMTWLKLNWSASTFCKTILSGLICAIRTWDLLNELPTFFFNSCTMYPLSEHRREPMHSERTFSTVKTYQYFTLAAPHIVASLMILQGFNSTDMFPEIFRTSSRYPLTQYQI